MDIEFGIRVVNKDGDGVEGARVFVSYLFTHQEDCTGSDGWVHFTRGSTVYGGVRANIFVNGEKVGNQIWVESGDTFSFSV